MQLKFKSSYQGIHEYELIKIQCKSTIRVRHNINSGDVKIDDYCKELSQDKKREVFKLLLESYRSNRNALRAKFKSLRDKTEIDIYRAIFFDAIKSNQRMFRANKNLH